MRLEVNSIRQTGAELVIIANGKPHHADSFRKDLKLTNPIFVDPKLGTYKALKLKYGFWYTLGPIGWWSAIIALSKGYRNKKYTGDVWQQGGTFLVMPNGQVPYHYISKHPGDHPNPKDFITILNNIFKQVNK